MRLVNLWHPIPPSGKPVRECAEGVQPTLSQHGRFRRVGAWTGHGPGNVLSADFVWRFATGSAADTTPPQVSSVRAAPSLQSPGGLVNLSAVVTDDGGVASVTVRVVGPKTDVNLTMTKAGGDTWFAERAFPTPGDYTFTAWATDGAGNVAWQSGTFHVGEPTAGSDLVATALAAGAVAATSALVALIRRRGRRGSKKTGPG